MSECILICGQFDILCCSLRNLRYTVLLKNRFRVTELAVLSGYSYTGANRCTLPDDECNIYFSGQARIIDPILREKNKHNELPLKCIQMQYPKLKIIKQNNKELHGISKYIGNKNNWCMHSLHDIEYL